MDRSARPGDHDDARDPAALRTAGSDAIRQVVDFLRAMERRDLDAARVHLAPDFAMCFPGGHAMTRLEQLVERSALRYRHVAKDFETLDACDADGRTVVYCAGRLRGEWVDGTAFSGIRFIDRFELRDGRIVRQDVWNDMAAVGR